MKKILIILIFLTYSFSFGQACGKYRIKYVGTIKSDSIKIEKIKIPTIMFLHGLRDEDSESTFTEIQPIENEINFETISHLTSNLYNSASDLLEFYKSKRESFPIIFIVISNNETKNIRMEISWEDIQISKINDEKFGNLFELNLKETDVFEIRDR